MSDEPTATAPTGDQDRITDSAAPVPSYGALLGGFIWPPCCDLIRVKVGWRFRTQRPGGQRRMRLWWVPTRRMADAVAKRWVEKEGRQMSRRAPAEGSY